ncbi:hypothetical protein Tco_1165589 [Tanacetum coccineum]
MYLGDKDRKNALSISKLKAARYLDFELEALVPLPWIESEREKEMMRSKMCRKNEFFLHKFSDGTLTRVLDKLDHMVKDFRLYKYNKGMESRIWSKDDKRRSEAFMEVIERRLKIRSIFRSLESFASGRLRDVDYRLLTRME